VDPKSYRKLSVCLARSWCPYVKVETVLAIRRLLAITPLSCISTWIMNCLVTWMSECISNLYAFPWNYWLWLLPTEVTDRWRCIWNTAVNCHAFNIGCNTLYLTTFDGEDRALLLCTCRKQQRKNEIE
jgi:hypothetical protein